MLRQEVRFWGGLWQVEVVVIGRRLHGRQLFTGNFLCWQLPTGKVVVVGGAKGVGRV